MDFATLALVYRRAAHRLNGAGLATVIGQNIWGLDQFSKFGVYVRPQKQSALFKNFDRRSNRWQLVFVAGIILGAFVGSHFLSINPVSFLPDHYYSLSGMARLALGGLLVGFGVRYAGGCTSGHTIMGLSNLQWSSLVASISFFAGGLLLTHVLQF